MNNIQLNITLIENQSCCIGATDPQHASIGTRLAYFSEYQKYVPVKVFDGAKLKGGNIIDGPALVEEVTTGIVVLPGWRLLFDPCGYYVMSFGENA